MAKRKRLTPALPEYLNAPQSAPEVKSALGAPITPPADIAPIAHVAGESAMQAALEEVSAEMQAARAEGRMVQKLPLDSIVADHLSRDRINADAGELGALIDSIRSHGQRTPIEVMALRDGRFGLISGWRRLMALEHLAKETGESRFDSVLALLRRPESASDAYVTMVEENEIRVGLSYYERARVVALAAKEGVFVSEAAALTRLFATASRAKRSKIRAFLTIYHALDDVLRFPAQLGERLGLSLAKALDVATEGGATRNRAAVSAGLLAANARNGAEEMAAITSALASISTPEPAKTGAGAAPTPTMAPAPASSPAETGTGTELRPGVFLRNEGGYLKRRIVLEGPKVDVTFQERLETWLRTGL